MQIEYTNGYRIKDAVDLRVEYFKEVYREFTKEQEEEIRRNLAEYYKNHLGKDCVVVLAVEDGKAVACATLSVFSKAPNRRFPNGKYAEIYGVFAQKSKRCKGYATALVKELLVLSDRMGMPFVELDASADGL